MTHMISRPWQLFRSVRPWSVIAIVAFMLPLAAYAIDNKPPMEDPALRARYEVLTNELRCLVCQNQTIADSTAPLAVDLRREVRELLLKGESDKAVREFMVARYGDFVLYRPPVKPVTWPLWGAPIILLLIGLACAFFIVARRRKLDVSIDVDEALIEQDSGDLL